jgi:BMFP domain-containing protein YqiC
MGKFGEINQLTNLLCVSLRHKIGSIVNKEEVYASKYAKDAEVFLNESRKIVRLHNWNNYKKQDIKQKLKKKLFNELKSKDFINSEKFDIMDKEIDDVLEELNLL